MSNRAWVTLATNDSYGLGALVLAHSLRQAGSQYPAVVLITPSVTDAMRERLRAVFAEVVTVDVLDSRDAAHLALLQRPELGITFTKIHCWNLTQYEKCVFLDADTLVVQNCDELFEREELSAAPDVGWPDCFNSGVFVFSPSTQTFTRLVAFAQERGSFDGGDQGLLNSFFSDWARGDINKHLPFLYNVTSAAFYSYLPALKHYGQDLKIIHFIGTAKPWLQHFNFESRTVDAPEHIKGLLQLWWDIFTSQVHTQLETSMVEVEEPPPETPPPTLPPQDVSQHHHYRPVLNQESEFPWHRPDAQIDEVLPENRIDLENVHDPWDMYRGHIPPHPRDDTISHIAESENRVEMRQYAWSYQHQEHNAASSPQRESQSHYENWSPPPPTHHSTFDQNYDHRHHHHEQSSNDNNHYHSESQWKSHHYNQQISDQIQPQNQEHWHQAEQNREHYHHVPSHSYDNKYFTENHEHKDKLLHDQHLHFSHQHFQHDHKHDENFNQSHNFTTPHSINNTINNFQPEQESNKSYEHYDHIHNQPENLSKHFEPPHKQNAEVRHVHVEPKRKQRRRPRRLKIDVINEINGLVNCDVSDTDSDFLEEIIPRHPYDGFYLRHIATIDSRGRKICTHEIPLTPTPSPTPSDSPTMQDYATADENYPSDSEVQSGVAGNLARVVPGTSSYEALDELTRRQGWEAGNIDYMGADSFDKIWAKISQTLNQPRVSPPKEPSPLKQSEPLSTQAEEPKTSEVVEVTKEAVPVEALPVVAPESTPEKVQEPVQPSSPEKTSVSEQPPAQEPVKVATSISEQPPAPEPVKVATPISEQSPAPKPVKVATPISEQPPAPEPVKVATPISEQPPALEPVKVATPISEQPPAPEPVKVATPISEQPPALEPVKVATPTSEQPPAPEPVKVATPISEQPPALEPVKVATPVSEQPPVPEPVKVETPTSEQPPASKPATVETPVTESEKAPTLEQTSKPKPVKVAEPVIAPTSVDTVTATAPIVESPAVAPATTVKPEPIKAPEPVAPAVAPAAEKPVEPVVEPKKTETEQKLGKKEPAVVASKASEQVAPASPTKAEEVPAKTASTPEATKVTLVTDSPPLANTPSKEKAPAVPAAKSEERRKPAGKLQLAAPSVADPLPTPDSELEDAATLAHAIIAGELRTPTVTGAPDSPAAPTSPPAPKEPRKLSVEEPQVPTPPVGAVSLAQIGVKSKEKTTIAEQIESSIAAAAAPATPPSPPAPVADAPKKKVVKKVKKDGSAAAAAASSDVPAPVPPPRKKEKKPKEK